MTSPRKRESSRAWKARNADRVREYQQDYYREHRATLTAAARERKVPQSPQSTRAYRARHRDRINQVRRADYAGSEAVRARRLARQREVQDVTLASAVRQGLPWSVDEDSLIRRLRAEGRTYAQIALMVGRSYSSVSQHARLIAA